MKNLFKLNRFLPRSLILNVVKNIPMFTFSKVTIKDLEVHRNNIDLDKAIKIYKKHGCLVVRGLNNQYV